MAKSKYPVLTAIVGPSKGKRFVLKRDSYTCGLDRKCAIRLKGDFVSDEHFVVRVRDDGNWVAENKSEYGTLVNAARVETRILSNGDNIQVGTGNVLVFTSAQSTGPDLKADIGDTTGFSGKKLAIGLGILMYIAAMVYAAWLFTSEDPSNGQLSIGVSRIDTEVSRTIDYIKQNKSDGLSMGKAGVVVDRAVPSYRYFRILAMQEAGVPASTLEEEYQLLEEELRSKLYSVYKLMASGQRNAALKALDDIYAMVPDVRAPITVFALSLRPTVDGSKLGE